MSAGWLLALLAVAAAAAAEPPRFYFSGDGTLALDHAHFAGETLRVRYRDADGRYDHAALARVEHFFRSREDGAQGPMSLRLLELLDYVEDRYHPTRLTLVSGYRSPEFNRTLRGKGRQVAQASLHTEGMAADVHPAGVKLRPLWNQLRAAQVGGVGLYQGEGFLHLDTGRARFWEAATSGVAQNAAQENARLFARTDFDRYDSLAGAVLSLHSVTALPIGVRRTARLDGDPVALTAPGARDEGECWVFTEAAARYELVVETAIAAPSARTPLVLETCAPRAGATPRQITTNAVQRLALPSP